jgi:hypothetical protein
MDRISDLKQSRCQLCLFRPLQQKKNCRLHEKQWKSNISTRYWKLKKAFIFCASIESLAEILEL